MTTGRYQFSVQERYTLEKLPAYLCVFQFIDDNFEMLLFSDAIAKKLGCPRSEVPYYYFRHALLNFDRESFLAIQSALWEAKQVSEKPCYFKSRIKAYREEKYFWINGSIRSEFRDEQRLFFMELADTTELMEKRQEAEKTTNRRFEMARQLIDAAEECFFWKDKDGCFMGANRAYLDFFGFTSEEELIGRKNEEYRWFRSADKLEADEREVYHGKPFQRVHRQCLKNGEVRDILMTEKPLYDGKEVIGLTGNFLDISIEKTMEKKIGSLNEEIRRSLEKEIESDHAKNILLSRVSHEIRTPLNAILGISELSLENNPDEKMQEAMKKIHASGKYLLGILNDILAMSDLNQPGEKIISKETDIVRLIDTTSLILSSEIQKKQIQFSVHYDELPFQWCLTDRLRLEQILGCLISNAVKYSSKGQSVSLDIGYEKRERDMLKFTVTDHGCGIASAFLPHVFEPFMQERKTSEQYGGGLGLGLANAKMYVTLMGGKISVISEEKKGSVFTVVIPVEPIQKEQQKADKKQAEENSFNGLYGKKVLIAEDNLLNQEVAVGLLEQIHITAVVAENGQEVIRKFEEKEPGYFDAILMDIQMPVLDGLKASEKIRALKRADASEIPIIAMSADVFDEAIAQARLNGMNDFIGKPVGRKTLYQVLMKWIG